MFRRSMAKIEARAMADCELEAAQKYIDEHVGGERTEELLGVELTTIVTEKIKKPRGNILVTVTFISRKPWECETYMFNLQIVGRKVHRRQPNS